VREKPKITTVQLPNWIASTSREVKVTIEYRDHEIVCDQPFCDEAQTFWISDITHLEHTRFFFTDRSVITISGTIKNSRCPIADVNFNVKTASGFDETFQAATNAFGQYLTFGPLGKLTIEPYLDGRQFQYKNRYSSYTGLFDNYKNGLDFTDITMKNLKMNVIGGDRSCNATLGSGYANL